MSPDANSLENGTRELSLDEKTSPAEPAAARSAENETVKVEDEDSDEEGEDGTGAPVPGGMASSTATVMQRCGTDLWFWMSDCR